MIEYSRYHHRLKKLAEKAGDVFWKSPLPKDDARIEEIRELLRRLSTEESIRIAFTGVYNAGKSTLIRCLTGEDVVIHSDVATTEVTTYRWKGILFVDTPGVRSGEPEHDLLADQAVVDSDLIVFVVTNELFSPSLHAFFKDLASDRRRDRAMMIVVNKMARSVAPPEKVLQGIEDAIRPFDLSQFFPVLTDGKRYLRSLEEEDGDQRERFLRDSNIGEFEKRIDEFVRERGRLGRLLGTVSAVGDVLTAARDLLLVDDAPSRHLLEFKDRQRRVFTESKRRIEEMVRQSRSELRGRIVSLAQEVIEALDDGASREDVVKIHEAQIAKATEIATEITEVLRGVIEDEAERIFSAIQDLVESDYARNIALEIRSLAEGEYDTEGIDPSRVPLLVKRAPALIKDAGNFLARNQKLIHDGIYKAGKLFGMKFKPWGAAGPAAKIAKAGPWIAGIGAAIDLVLEIKRIVDEDDAKLKRREARAGIRQGFRDLSEQVFTDIERDLQTVYKDLFKAPLDTLDREIRDLHTEQAGQKDIAQRAIELIEEVKDLQKMVLLAEA